MNRLALFSLSSSLPWGEDPATLLKGGLLEEALLLRTCWRRELYALLPETPVPGLPEPDLRAQFEILLSQAATKTMTFDYATANGGASAGSDYTAKSGTVTIADRMAAARRRVIEQAGGEE